MYRGYELKYLELLRFNLLNGELASARGACSGFCGEVRRVCFACEGNTRVLSSDAVVV